MSVKKNLIKNGISSGILKIIKILEQLLLVPFFITAWGSAYYGEWLTLTIIPTVIGLSDFGFGTAAANTFVLKYASGDKQGAANIYKCGIWTISIIILFSLLLSIFIIGICNYLEIFDKSLIKKYDAIIAVLILMFSKIITFYKQLFDAYFRASKRFNVSVNMNSLYSLVILISSVIILIFKGGVIILTSVNLIFTILYIIIHSILAKRTLPMESINGNITKVDMIDLMKVGFGYLIVPVWQAIFFQGTTFVVRIILGPVSVAIFNTVRALTRLVYQSNAVVINSIIPELQYAIGELKFELAQKLFRSIIIIVSLLSFFGVLFLITVGPWIYEVWTKKALFPPDIMWYVFIVGVFFNSIWVISSEVILAANKPYHFTISALISSSISLLISYLLIKKYGLSGAAFGSLILDILLCFYLIPVSCKFLKQPICQLYSQLKIDLKPSNILNIISKKSII